MPDCWDKHSRDCWADYSEPIFVAGPHEGDVRFGAQVGWNPRREGQREVGCKECGGLLVFLLDDPSAAVPIPLAFDPATHGMMVAPDDVIVGNKLCPSCMRWARDNHLAMLMDAEFLARGSNLPIEVAVPRGCTVSLPIAHNEAYRDAVVAPVGG